MIDVEHLKQCQHNLVVLLGRAQEKAVHSYMEDSTVFDTLPMEAKSIALATVALLKLDGHAPEYFGPYSATCLQEFQKSGGIKIALKALDTLEAMQTLLSASCQNQEAMQALGYMLSLCMDKPFEVNIESNKCFIDNQEPLLLMRALAEDGSESEVPVNILCHCRPVLEACLQHREW